MLDDARPPRGELSQFGALYPWRTINGDEASAYFQAGTAQYHLNADIAYALIKYVRATGDRQFLLHQGVDILVETARLWADVGSGRLNGDQSFHIHGVTGPDEYNTVVNDNFFTNVMARLNLEAAVEAVRDLQRSDPEQMARAVARLGLREEEVDVWGRCARGMHVPFDERTGIHPQDSHFLEREVWDLDATPADRRPLLLYYHPLVIYRFQVLKQADVVLALYLVGDHFSVEDKLADFDYYDPIRPATPRSPRSCSRSSQPRWATTSSHCATSTPDCSSTWPTGTATPSTACTWPPPEVCGARWWPASAGCATTTAG